VRTRRVPTLTVFGIRPSALLDLYRWRLSEHRVQELLACVGVATGVALMFGVLVASTSITSSASEFLHAVTGRATLEVAARSSNGFDEHVAHEFTVLPGVQVAARILRQDVTIVGPKGRELVQILGVTPALTLLEGSATRNYDIGTELASGGVGLPSSVASSIGARASQRVTLLTNGEAHRAIVHAVLGSQAIGAVADSPVVVSLLSVAQALSGAPGRVTQIFIKPERGRMKAVERELRDRADGRLDIEPADHELALLNQASVPTRQSTTLFAAISAMVGFLLALNAMLLTVPARRRFVAELRTQGFGPEQVLVILGSQALVLGAVSSLLGVAAGVVLSHTLFHAVPSYLTFAFPIGTQRFIKPEEVGLAILAGLLAASLASVPAMLDLLPRRPIDAAFRGHGEAGHSIGTLTTATTAAVGVALVTLVSVVIVAVPRLTLIGAVLLAIAAICLVPMAFTAIGTLLAPLSERLHGSMLALAVVELRATATRSIALASVAALAVYGSVAIQSARHDLSGGLRSAISQYLATADVWVTTGANVFTTDSFLADGALARVARSPGVLSARIYQGSLLDYGSRRLWIRARPAGDSQMLQSSQMVEGDFATATTELRNGGWAAISQALANEHHVKVGDPFELPTPSGELRLRVAALTTNTGWPSGAVTINTSDYRRAWMTADPSAIEVNLQAGVSPAQGARIVRGAIGDNPALSVQTRRQREAQFRANARQALRTLGQISTLLLLVAALSIALALSAAIWQRRDRLASLKSQGFDAYQLWRSVLLESAIVLCIGCVDGAMLGVYGHALEDRWLRLQTGFPAPFTLDPAQILITLAILLGAALLVVAIPGMSAARIAARAGFQE
jgi:putative ABC transport system permease protein